MRSLTHGFSRSLPAQAKQEAGKLVVKEKQLDGSEKEKTTTVGQYDADEITKRAKANSDAQQGIYAGGVVGAASAASTFVKNYSY